MLDLSKATKLRNVAFRSGQDAEWISKTLRTVQLQNLQHISLELPPRPLFVVEPSIWRAVRPGWLDLDFLLAQLWTSHSLYIEVMHGSGVWSLKDYIHMAGLLPGLTKREIVGQAENSADVEWEWRGVLVSSSRPRYH